MRLGLGYSVQFAIVDTNRRMCPNVCIFDDNQRHDQLHLQVYVSSIFLRQNSCSHTDNHQNILQLDPGLNSLFNHGGLTHKTLGQTWKFLYLI